MRTRDIKQWLRAADSAEAESPYDSDDEMAPDHEEPARPSIMEEAESDWDAFISCTASLLHETKSKRRHKFVNETIPMVANDPETTSSERVALYKLLLEASFWHTDLNTRFYLVQAGYVLLEADTASAPAKPCSSMLVDEAVHALEAETERLTRPDLCYTITRIQLETLYAWLHYVLTVVIRGDHAELKKEKAFIQLVRMRARVYGTHMALRFPWLQLFHCIMTKHRAWEEDLSNTSLIIHVALTIQAPDAWGAFLLQERILSGAHFTKEPYKQAAHEFIDGVKAPVLQYYTTHVICSKTPVPRAVRDAIAHPWLYFFDECVSQADLDERVLPSLQKMLLRSPETAFLDFGFLCSRVNVDKAGMLSRFQNAILSSLASSNRATREAVLTIRDTNSRYLRPRRLLWHDDLVFFIEALCKSIKPGDVRSEEQRLAQYFLMKRILASPKNSPALLTCMAPIIQKETQPTSVKASIDAILKHVEYLPDQDEEIPPVFVKALLSKTHSPKAPIRAAALCGIYPALRLLSPGWTTRVSQNESRVRLFKELMPSLGTSIQSAQTGALTSLEAALEGCVAVALIWGPLGPGHPLHAEAASLAPLDALLAAGSKPSFLLNEKVAHKMGEHDLVHWHANALSFVLARQPIQKLHDKDVHAHVLALLRGYVHHSVHLGSARYWPKFVSSAQDQVKYILERIRSHDTYLALDLARQVLGSENDVAPKVVQKLLMGVRTEDRVPDMIVLAHAPQLLGLSDTFFVPLCLVMDAEFDSLDPPEVVTQHVDHMLRLIYDAHADPAWRASAEAALSTVALIAPDVVLPRVCGDIVRHLSVQSLEAWSAQDVAIWRAPGDKPYVDVLASHKSQQPLDKGRTTSMDQWDAEVRASIAAKKAASAPKTLSQQDQAAVDAQLAREREIRDSIERERTHVLLALRRVRTVLRVPVPDTATHMFRLTMAVWTCLKSERARSLGVTEEAVHTLQALSQACEARAKVVCGFIYSAMLRDVDAALVPLDYALESGEEIELRILYQLRFLVDAAPLELGSCGFVVPWLVHLVDQSRLGGDEAQDDRVVERLQLAVDTFAAHAVYGADTAFPRAETVRALLVILRRMPMLVHDSVAALRAFGEMISRTHEGQYALIMQLLEACLSEERRERDGALQCLVPLDLTELEFSPALWLAMHSDLAPLASQIWTENALDVPSTYVSSLVPLLRHAHAYVRTSAARAVGAACALHPDTLGALLEALRMLYHAENYSLAPEYDQYGMVIESTLGREDPWHVRVAVARAIEASAPSFRAADVVPFFVFALQPGTALSDRHEAVRHAMLEASSAVIDARGDDVLSELLSQLEASLESEHDAVTEAAVVLLGRAARYLPADSAHVRRIVERLLSALRTPSELVQEAVASCLPALVRASAAAKDVPSIVDRLFVDLLHGDKYATRRGAAYGLAGVVKGRGVSAIRELRILARLSEAAHDTSTTTTRQGALFAYELLASTLHVLLEPYVDGILADLLLCFGDTHADVREATQDAARVLMRSLSGQCLKLILPSLLDGLDEKQWRTKKGAVELLGAMAFCAPRQLSAALPTIIPRLSEVLTDSHRQVSAAANQSLKQFGEVIHNPEIHALVPSILKALVDPNAKTALALKGLLRTKFVHYIDAPSLALIAPIIERGLRERTVLLQKQAAQIVGHLASLTDARDYVPYLAKLTPLVRVVLVSPVPDARGVAAKALGTLVERLGEVHFVDLVPSLLQVLRTDATGVDRHGAAQGLAEVLAGLGMERMERLLPTIIENTQDSTPYVREGHLALLIYLPATFGARFLPHLQRIVPPIVASMADDIESVREASLRAGRMLITNYTQRSVDLLLPQLEPRLFDTRHRVRLSALQLTADMLFRVSGISGKAEVENEADDETDEAAVASSSVQRTLVHALGAERRARILASIFILRQDPSMPVRQTAAHTWKALVHNTPRTAREVLPVMLDILLSGSLASDDAEQREMAGRTLGELVRKLGEKILSETVPILSERATHAPKASVRAGVCRAVTDVLSNATKTQLEDHEDALIGVVRHALGDAAPDVRAAAAHALDAMQAHLGAHAIDATIPTLLEALDDERAPTALAALTEVVRTQPDIVFPVVVPTLAHVPVSASHAAALVALLPVAGTALPPQISVILSSLAASCDDETQVRYDVADALFEAITGVDALHQCVLQLLGWLSARSPTRQALACHLFVHFSQRVTVPWTDYEVDFVRKLVSLYEHTEERVFAAARSALDACLHAIPKEHWGDLVVPLRRAIESTGAPSTPLAGLCQTRGASPFVPVLLHGLLQGTAEQREQGALGLADLVEKTTPDALKPFITAMVGPLIRLCGDRHAPPVKMAILTSLHTMVQRVPLLVRPFYPQLQRSFQKALSDPASATVRSQAAHALGRLMGLQTRVEGVVNELVSTLHRALAEPDDTADAAATALACLLTHVPHDKLSDGARASIAACLHDAFHADEEPREALKKALADVLAALVRFDAHAAEPLLSAQVLLPAPVDVHLAALCLRACMEQAPDALYAIARPPSLVSQLTAAWLSEAPSVARAARETREMLRRSRPWNTDDTVLSAL